MEKDLEYYAFLEVTKKVKEGIDSVLLDKDILNLNNKEKIELLNAIKVYCDIKISELSE